MNKFYAISPANCEELLYNEVLQAGAKNITQTIRAIFFSGEDRVAYWLCLNSRIANRVILILKEDVISDSKSLYNVASEIFWDGYFDVEKRFTINCNIAGNNITEIIHTNYGAQVVKDAVCDFFRDKYGERPNLDSLFPDVVLNVQIVKDRVIIGIDYSGEILSKRGYRISGGLAPLKENSATAILLRAGWDKCFYEKKIFLDFMCGSGTFLIEAALIATNTPPGIFRARNKNFCFLNLNNFDKVGWDKILKSSEEKIIKTDIKFLGFDIDKGAVISAKKNIAEIGFSELIEINHKDCFLLKSDYLKKLNSLGAFIAMNPPYGIRVGDRAELKNLYSNLGKLFKENFENSKIVIVSDDKDILKCIDIKADKINQFYNGGLEIFIGIFSIFGKAKREDFKIKHLEKLEEKVVSKNCQMFINRLIKNSKNLKKFLEQNNITAYRLYDADMPEYSAIVDVYKTVDDKTLVYIAEYTPPKTIDENARKKRAYEIVEGVETFFKITKKSIFFKTRTRQKGLSQYQKFDDNVVDDIIFENGFKFYINLSEYLDTFIFLDDRAIRRVIKEKSKNKKFLNLFCYTATATVYAVFGGALKTVSVDKSNKYLDVAEKNFELNQVPVKNNFLIRDDVISYLQNCEEKFDLIFLAPPTFSNSKDLRYDFDIQKLHIELIEDCMKLLSFGGELIFSTNYKKFILDEELTTKYLPQNFTEESLDFDFKNSKFVHKCWIFKQI